MATLWWVVLLAVVCLLFFVHYRSGMSLADRISVALEIVRNSHFRRAEGMEQARREDPDLLGWIQCDRECVMLFRKQSGRDTIEIVDVVSPSFHPGLVIHYRNGVATRGDGGEITDPYIRKIAGELLRETRRQVHSICASQVDQWDGFRY